MDTFEDIYKYYNENEPECNERKCNESCYYCQAPLPSYMAYEDCDGHKVCERCYADLIY